MYGETIPAGDVVLLGYGAAWLRSCRRGRASARPLRTVRNPCHRPLSRWRDHAIVGPEFQQREGAVYRARVEVEVERVEKPSLLEGLPPRIEETHRLRWQPQRDDGKPTRPLTFVRSGGGLTWSEWREEIPGRLVPRDMELVQDRQALTALWYRMTGAWGVEALGLELDAGRSGEPSPDRLRVVLGGGRPGLVFEARRDSPDGRPVYRRIADGEARAIVTDDGVPDHGFERTLAVIAGRLLAGDFTVDTDDTQY